MALYCGGGCQNGVNLRARVFSVIRSSISFGAEGPLFPLTSTDNSDRQFYSASLASCIHNLQVYLVARSVILELFQSIRLSITWYR